ncbi:Protein of unknown function (DUF3465) [Desulfocapsa sulfexigens DSM 10523]|uniref:DUF3465 domain-containing protein n=1 Tax=Desulfocapsa sulfexigens (strain DSM 10523 / SB164P1) TaxID=1167006 RepID=M1P461_DESSD|nr:DUF3465 domain-containing protein [Desulfocapsa sulfexigens]AGF78273.1 Protein of unknown function (DUF3465) [Desulfocapsa sulfexigens DSM 10523]
MKKTSRNNILLALFALVIYLLAQQGENFSDIATVVPGGSETTVEAAFANQQSDLQIQGRGIVKKVLPDDREGTQHQKFILQVDPDQTVLVAHNIDVAARLEGLEAGDTVEFYGEYEWTAQGGVIHWTHRDLDGRHTDGWLRYNGKTYQ